MKVDSSPDSYIGSVAGGPQKAAERPNAGAEAAAAAGAAAKPQAPAGVTVTLSSSTSQAISGTGGSSSDVFNAEAIADKMLSNAAEMLSGSNRA